MADIIAAPVWYTSSTATTALNITVSDKRLQAAREQCCRARGLRLDLPNPPSESFAQGVVHQALAMAQAAQANSSDEYGQEGVRLYPLDRKILAMLIVPEPDDPTAPTADLGRVRSLIG